jgi:cell pole-organizing protein PopZ
MEEIIASISRIIAEDRDPANRRAAEHRSSQTVPSASGEGSDILELTQRVDEDDSVRRVTRQAEGASAQSGAPEAAAAASTANAGRHMEAESLRPDTASEPRLEPGRDRIVSAATSGAAAAAFAQLGALALERRREGELALGGTERTLEEIVREILRPLLQAWLDAHLPGIVDRLVREEIARVVGEAGLR